MLRFVGDLRALQQWVSLGLARLLVGSVTTVAALVALSLLNTRLSLAVGAVLAVGAGAAVSLGGRLRAATLEARLHRGRLAANMGEKVASLAVVQLFGQPERERRRVNRDSRRLQHAMVRRARVAGLLRAITEGTAAAATAVALLVGAHEVGSGRATPGTVVAAMAVVGLLHSPLRDMSRVQEYWQYAGVAHRKIREFLLIPSLVTEKKGAPDLVASQGQLEFDAVELSGALDHVTACAGPGARVALVGPNGAGKSTLLAVAARLIDPDSGVVKVDGQDLKEHSLHSVRRAVGIVGPDLPLLRGTVDKNLKYRWPDAPEDEIAEVKALCRIDEILAELPEGGATRISEGGVGLSAGQRQRISLARALLGRPSVLLLDEVDAHLDPRAGEVVDRVLTEFKGTVVMVTHRPDRLRAVDAIWHLQNGRLVEQGAPGRLALSNGPTSRLFGLTSTAAGPRDETA
jgi:ABC-type multidrug transport system fused ATPase/permease subunit